MGAYCSMLHVYMVFILIGIIKYYINLENRMIATEYILTFIPIDEINGNAKIGRYVRKRYLVGSEQINSVVMIIFLCFFI